jgi:hypothetical protein
MGTFIFPQMNEENMTSSKPVASIGDNLAVLEEFKLLFPETNQFT